MSAQHTPGPWRHEWTNDAKETLVVVAVDTFRNGATAVIGCCAGPDKEANARLIAEAPELLDLAREIADNAILAGMEIGQKARELIAKATGEQA